MSTTSTIVTNLVSIPTSTTAVYASSYGNPSDVLRVGRVSLPDLTTAAPGTVLVRMLAAPVNPSDINAIQGVYPIPLAFTGEKGIDVPGFEGVGQVVAIHSLSAANGLQLGDLVIPSGTVPGTWRHHLVLPAANLIPLKRADDARALPISALANLSVNPCTAFRMLQDFAPNMQPGDVVVQNGGNSAVGQYVAQLGHLWGLRVISVVRDRPDFDVLAAKLKAQGAYEVVRPNELRRLVHANKDSWGSRIHLALNTVGGQSATDLLRVLAVGGTLVTYGGMSKDPIAVPTAPLIFKDVRLRGFWMSEWKKRADEREYRAMLDELVGYVAESKIQAPEFQEVVVKQVEHLQAGEQEKIVGRLPQREVRSWARNSCLCFH
ncbi:mitochondrial trans-2-enoyl-CoA reductase, partial [Catenaria anguillulae PL171]